MEEIRPVKNPPSPEELISSIPSPYLEDLLFLSRTIRENGGSSFLVGGSVRDLILGKLPQEYDLAVSILPEEIQKIFPRTVPTGIKHGTITVLVKDRSYELTTFRKDEDYQDGRRPETVHFGVSLSEDLRRRDFTINAIALDLVTKQLIDEHEGLEDIQAKIIRTIGDPIARFTEDGLRPVRGIRFVSSLGFQIAPETKEAIRKCKPITAKVSPERIHDEFLKTLKAKDPRKSLALLKDYGIFELFTKARLYEDSPNWESNLAGFSGLPSSPDRIRLAFFLGGAFSSKILQTEAPGFLKDLKFSNQRTKDSLFLCRMLDALREKAPNLRNPGEIRKSVLHPIAQNYGKQELEIWLSEISLLWQAGSGQTPEWLSLAEEEWRKNPPLVLGDLALDGNQIRNAFPTLEAKKLGDALRACLDFVLENPAANREEDLTKFLQSWT